MSNVGEFMPPPDPLPNDQSWELMIEAKLRKVTLVAYVDGAVAVGALAVGYLAMKGLTNLAKALGQIGEITNGLQQVVYGQPNVGSVATPPKARRTNGGREVIDETIEPPPNSEVAEPAMGPETETSDKVKGLIASDPISPADLMKQDKLPMDDGIIPT